MEIRRASSPVAERVSQEPRGAATETLARRRHGRFLARGLRVDGPLDAGGRARDSAGVDGPEDQVMTRWPHRAVPAAIEAITFSGRERLIP